MRRPSPGSPLLVIGTLVSSRAWLAAVVSVPVGFATFFAGVAGRNAASGVLAALLAYVLPAASPGTAGEIPSRLAGWWLAREHLRHLDQHAQSIPGPAAHLAEERRLPWWRP